MTRLHRPQTVKEVKREARKRAGGLFISKEEQARLIRAQEREDRHKENLKKEAARKEAAKRRAEKEAKQREERRRLGIPDPTVKVSPGQMRMGDFLKGKNANEPVEVEEIGVEARNEKNEAAPGSPGSLDGKDENPNPEALQLPCPGGLRVFSQPDGSVIVPAPANTYLEASPDEHGLNTPKAVTTDAILPGDPQFPVVDESGLVQHAAPENQAPDAGKLSSPLLPPTELRSSFFASNSQIDRELNQVEPTSVIDELLLQHANFLAKADCTPKAATEPHGSSTAAQLPPPCFHGRSELETFLNGLPSEELDCI